MIPTTATDWVALTAVAVTLLVATASGLWAVFVRSQENERAEWRRIQELTDIIHNGSTKGLWAQQLAVDEIFTLRRRRAEVGQFLDSAELFFSRQGPAGAVLGAYIKQRRKS